jgi:hypothetical protein
MELADVTICEVLLCTFLCLGCAGRNKKDTLCNKDCTRKKTEIHVGNVSKIFRNEKKTFQLSHRGGSGLNPSPKVGNGFLLTKTPSMMGLKIGQSPMGLNIEPFRPEGPPQNFLVGLCSKIL